MTALMYPVRPLEPTVEPLLSDTARRRRVGSARTAIVAAFASPDTDRMGREVGFPLAVIAMVDDVETHTEVLSRTWHGAWQTSEGWFLPFDYNDSTLNSSRFSHIAFDERWMGRAALPCGVRLSAGSLEVAVPSGVQRSDLRQAFGQAMADRRFERVAERPARVRQRFATGRRLVVPCRYAASPDDGCEGRVVLVEDVYAFRPRTFPGVVSALEASVRILSMCSALAGAAKAGDRGA